MPPVLQTITTSMYCCAALVFSNWANWTNLTKEGWIKGRLERGNETKCCCDTAVLFYFSILVHIFLQILLVGVPGVPWVRLRTLNSHAWLNTFLWSGPLQSILMVNGPQKLNTTLNFTHFFKIWIVVRKKWICSNISVWCSNL